MLGIAVFLFHLGGACRASLFEPKMNPQLATRTNIGMPFISSAKNAEIIPTTVSSGNILPKGFQSTNLKYSQSTGPDAPTTAKITIRTLSSGFTLNSPTEQPTMIPINEPTASPTEQPIMIPINKPTAYPTEQPTVIPTHEPTASPTDDPTLKPTAGPTAGPTDHPSLKPTVEPTTSPSVPPTMIPTEYPSSLHIAAKTLTPTADSVTSRTDHPSLFTTAVTDKPTLVIVYALQAHVLVTLAQMVAEMDVSSTETFRNTTQAFLSNWLQLQAPPVSHVKISVLNQSLSKSTLRRRVAQATDIVISMLVSGDTKAGDLDLAAVCNSIFDDKGHILVDRLQATNDISFSQVVTVTSTNHSPVAVVEGGSKTSTVEGGTANTGSSNFWAIFSIYIWVAIFVGGIAFLIASFGTMRFIYKRRNAEKEQGKQKYQEEEPMSIEPATVVSTVVSRNTDFDSTTDYSVVERKRSCHRQSRQTLKPLFEDGISRNSETTGGDTGPLGLGPQCVCGCKQLGCTCALNLAVSESL